jgi:hypothetical protein
MALTMRAAVARAFGQPLAIEEVPVPTPGPGEVLVKIMASGVCRGPCVYQRRKISFITRMPRKAGSAGGALLDAISSARSRIGCGLLRGRCEHFGMPRTRSVPGGQPSTTCRVAANSRRRSPRVSG